MRTLNRQRGYLLITVVAMLFVFSAIVMLLIYDSSNNARSASSDLEAARAGYVARAGMQNALWRAQNNACLGNVAVPITDLGDDTFDATISGAAAGSLVIVDADQDAWIRNDDTTKNNGKTDSNHVRYESGKIEQVLTRFDVSSISSKARINSAIAWFHLKTGKDHPQGHISVHEIYADWSETSVTWDSFGGAYRAAAVSAIPAQDTGDTWVAVNITGLVQSWVNGQPNFGILFDSSAEGLHTEYTSREDGTNPPRLEVVVGSGDASNIGIEARGKLDNGVGRTLWDASAVAYQPPATAVFQPGPEGKDGWVNSAQTTDNYGASVEMTITGGASPEHFLIEFPVERIPRGSRVVSARMELYLNYLSGADPAATFSVHRMTEPWTEGSGDNWNPGDGANWNTSDGSDSWSWQTNHDGNVSVDTTHVDPSFSGWHGWDITSLAQQWATGAQPNFGVVVKGNANVTKAWFRSSDYSDPATRPRLVVEYACECGDPCMSPRGAGTVLLVRNQNNPTSIDTDNQERLESWGYTVNLINDWASQSEYDTAFASNDVVLISGASPFAVGTKLTNAPIGVVNSRGELNDELGIASGYSSPVSSQLDVVDNSHYITAIVPTGTTEIYASPMAGLAISGGAPTGAHELGTWGGNSSIVALDQGGDLSGGGNAAGRRVLLPIGATTPVNWRYVTNTGELILQRSIDWAMGADKTFVGKLLFVVGNANNPSNHDVARQSLFESMGYEVTLLDDGADPDKYKMGINSNDVVYVSSSINSGTLGDKLTGMPLGIVNEDPYMTDDFGFGDTAGNTVTYNSFTDTDMSHYISEPFSGASVTLWASNIAMPLVSGTLAPDLWNAASIGALTWAIPTLAAGAERWDGSQSLGRRAHLPYGNANSSVLTDDARTILKRALEWAAGAGPRYGPVAHWKLDETGGITAEDSVGGHDGTASNTEWVPGVVNGGLHFDSGSDAVLVPHADELSLTDQITIAAWINKTQLWGYDGGVVKATTGSDLNFLFGTWDRNPVFGFSTATDNWQGYYATGTTLSTNTWYHMATTFNNATDRVRIYVDGALAQEFSTALEPVTNEGNLMLGRTAIGEFWPGSLDDVRLYNRELSASEIEDLAQRPSAAPVAHWELDENTGSTAVDSLGGRVGTLANGASWTGGALGSGVRFDGSNDRINVAHDNGLNLVAEMTLSAWIYADALKPFQMVLTKGDNGIAENYWLATEGNKLNFGFVDGGLYAQYTSSSLTLEAGRWHHVAATFDNAADQVVLYVDGSAETFSSTYTPAANNEQLIIGSSYYGGEAFDGVIDDVRIYNSVLGAQEITDLAASGGGGGGGGASYVEKSHVFTVSNSNSWQTVDLSGQGVPPNAVVEIAMENTSGNREREAGIRAAGSSAPTYDLHEAEGGGVDALTKHVQADASGQIQAYAENSDDVQFRLLGYWTGGSYTNTDGLFTSSTSNSWRLHNMTSFGIQPRQVVEFIVQNTSGGSEYHGGVRYVGSGDEQMRDLHEAENGGKDFHSVFVQAADNVSAAIEAYAENSGSIEFKPAGMWVTPPGTYSQHDSTVDIGRPTSNNTWQTVDLTAFGVPPNAVVQITLANRNPGGERRMGVRSVGSSLDRYVDLHEPESGGEDLVTMHVKTDASSRIQWYHERPADSHRFYLMGWWVLD